jgi:hypothetical protein
MSRKNIPQHIVILVMRLCRDLLSPYFKVVHLIPLIWNVKPLNLNVLIQLTEFAFRTIKYLVALSIGDLE